MPTRRESNRAEIQVLDVVPGPTWGEIPDLIELREGGTLLHRIDQYIIESTGTVTFSIGAFSVTGAIIFVLAIDVGANEAGSYILWPASNQAVGTTHQVVVVATDSEGSRDEVFNILIVANAPSWVSIPNQMATEDEAFEFDLNDFVSGSDPTITVSGLPEGLSATAGVISGTPTETGTFQVSAVASNSEGSATTQFSIAVASQPVVPPESSRIFLDTANLLLPVGSAFSHTITVSPARAGISNINVTSVSNTPSWLSVSISGASFTLSGTAPSIEGVHPYNVGGTYTDNGTPRTISLVGTLQVFT